MWAFLTVTPVFRFAEIPITGVANLAITKGSDHLLLILAVICLPFALSIWVQHKTNSPTPLVTALRPSLYWAATLLLAFLSWFRASFWNLSLLFLFLRSLSVSCHLIVKGLCNSLPKNNSAGIAHVASCHAVLNANCSAWRFSSDFAWWLWW